MANSTVNVELVIEAGKSAKSLGDVKQSVKDVNAALKEVQFGTKEWEQLHEVFLKNRAVIKSMRQEFPGLKQLETIGKSVTASFAIATAAGQLLGSENEKLNEGLKKTAASLELMLGFKELAKSLREVAIANEGVNASLLTNPYVLLAGVILAAGIALTKFAEKGTDMGDALVELRNRASGLNPVWEVLKAGVVGFVTDLITGTAAVLNFTASLLGMKEKSTEAEDAYERNNKILKGSTETIKNHTEEIENNAKVYKSATDDKIAVAGKEIETEKEKLKWVENYYQIAVEQIALNAQLHKQGDDAKESLKQYAELSKQRSDLLTEITVKQNALNKALREEAEAAAKEKEIEAIAKVKKGLDDIIESDEHYLVIQKDLGATALEENAQAIINNENELKHINEQVEAQKKIVDSKAKSGVKDKEATTAYEALLDLQKKNIQLNETLIAQGVKLDNDETKKKELANLEVYKKEYEALVKTKDADYKAAEAAGKTETTLSVLRQKNYDDEMSYLKNQIATIQASNITDEEKKKQLEDVNVKIEELTGNFKVLNAQIAQYNKLHFFTADQQKEITTAETYIGKFQQSIGAAGQAATQIAKQEADKRIAIYQQENDIEQASLSNRLQLGLVTQQQYDAQKKALDDNLAKEKLAAQKKAFAIDKAFKLESAVVSTALAIVNALDTPIPYPGPLIFAALAGAMGGVEIGTIAASQPPAFATGGIFMNGGSVSGVGTETSDSINARLSDGESVINSKSTKAFAPLLSAINQIGGGVAFKGQPAVGTSHSQSTAPASTPSSQANPQKVYVTEYDITRTQNKVAVIQNRSTF